jgi:hypothetical protein
MLLEPMAQVEMRARDRDPDRDGFADHPPARHPVKVNLLIRDFVEQLSGRR